MTSPPDEQPDLIVYVADGSGPPPYHVRDQEARYAALPRCELPAVDRQALDPVRLDAYPATLWLPELAAAEPFDPPPPTATFAFQGWDWPDGASVLVDVDRDPKLPGLYALCGADPGACGAVVGGRPVQIDRRGPDDSGDDFRAWVRGYFSEAAGFGVAVGAPSAARREELLAAVLLLTVDAAMPAPDPPDPPDPRGA